MSKAQLNINIEYVNQLLNLPFVNIFKESIDRVKFINNLIILYFI